MVAGASLCVPEAGMAEDAKIGSASCMRIVIRNFVVNGTISVSCFVSGLSLLRVTIRNVEIRL